MCIPLAHASLCSFYMHCLFQLDNSEVDSILCILCKQSQKQKSPTYNQVSVLETKCIQVIAWIHPGSAHACHMHGYQRGWIYVLSSAQTSLCELISHPFLQKSLWQPASMPASSRPLEAPSGGGTCLCPLRECGTVASCLENSSLLNLV